MLGKETFVKGCRFAVFNLQFILLGSLFKEDPIGQKCEKLDKTAWAVNKFQVLRRTPKRANFHVEQNFLLSCFKFDEVAVFLIKDSSEFSSKHLSFPQRRKTDVTLPSS